MSKTLEEFTDSLYSMDPDYIVDILEIDTSELIELYPDRVIMAYEREYG